MEMNAQPNSKKIAITSVFVILFAFFAFWLWSFFHTGKVIISTSNPTYNIKLSSFNGSKTTSLTGHSILTANLHTGEYLAVVEGNSKATAQVINLNSHKTLRYEINPNTPVGVEPVAYLNAQDLVADSNHLLYLNSDLHKISMINDQNNLSTVGDQQFLHIKWANINFGVGQDSNSHLYTLKNGRIAKLSVPFSSVGSSADIPDNFDVSPNERLYVSHETNVYIDSQNNNFKKIYTANYPDPIISAGTDGLAVVDGANGQGLSKNIELIVIDPVGKTYKLNTSVAKLSWSPNGQYLLAGDISGEAKVYTGKLKTIAHLPNISPVDQVAWLDNDTLFYSSNDQLWRYDLAQQKSEILANMPLASSISGISISGDKSYIYITTVDSSGDSFIKRVGLKGQKTPDNVYQLQSILPLSFGYCSLNLLNFTKPTILVQSPTAQSSQCQQQAKSELQQRGFDLNSLQISASS